MRFNLLSSVGRLFYKDSSFQLCLSSQISSKVSAEVSSQVSSQVRKELQALFFGSGQAGEEQGELPEALVLWLSQRYVSGADLQASLASLELSILRNVSLQLEMSKAQTLAEAQVRAQAHADTITQTVSASVQHTATVEGLSEEVLGHAVLLLVIIFKFDGNH